MTIVARRFASVPVRSAADTWAAILEMVAPSRNSQARRDLEAVKGVACSIIAGEISAPIIVHGAGPRLRIYCLYGDEAIEGDRVNEAPLAFDPTEGDWHMSIPCPTDDLAWVKKKLEKSARVTARDESENSADEAEDHEASRTVGDNAVNLDAYLRN